MTDQRTNPGIWYDAEKRPQKKRDREFIPTRLVAAMFSLAGIALVLVSLSVFTGRAPTGQPKDAPVWKTQVMTIEGKGNHVTIVEDTGRVLLDGNGGFIAVVLDGLERARLVSKVEGNPPVTITQYENGRVSLTDPATGWQVELSSFGPGNLGTFRKMLNGE
jgi:putative photosynthetic complex assembly protein